MKPMFAAKLQHRVAYINVLSGVTFSSSIRYWQNKSESEKRWQRLGPQTKPILIGHSDGLEINGDSDATVSAPEGGLIHIHGNLNADLEVGGHHEVILSGNTSSNTTINASGFFHIYIAGSMRGQIVTSGSSEIWIDGDFTGSIRTGSPSTKLHVGGDFSGDVSPANDASLLWLSVGGFADNELISAISQIGYTQFSAIVSHSNVDPGLYPVGKSCRKTEAGNSFSTWCVTQKRGT